MVVTLVEAEMICPLHIQDLSFWCGSCLSEHPHLWDAMRIGGVGFVLFAIALILLAVRCKILNRKKMQTEQNAFQQLQSAYSLLKSATINADISFFKCDPEGTDLLNQGFSRAFWPTDAEGRWVAPEQWVHPADCPTFKLSWQELTDGKVSAINLAYRTLAKGEPRYFELCASAETDPQTGQRIISGFNREVSKRERFRHQLFDAKTSLEFILDNLPVYVYIKSVADQFRFIVVPKNTLLHPPEELIGKNMFDLYANDFASADYEEDCALAEKGGAITKITTLQGHAGEKLVIKLYKKLLCRENGEKLILCMLSDISDETKDQEALANSTALLHNVIEYLPCYIFTKNASRDFRYEVCNQNMEKLWGIPVAEIIGKTDAELWGDAETATRLRLMDQQLLQTPHSSFSSLEDATDCKGAHRKFHLLRRAITKANGEKLVLGLGIDITELEEKRREIERTNAILRTILDTLPAWISVKDLKDSGHFRIWNATAEKISGLSAAEVLGHSTQESAKLASLAAALLAPTQKHTSARHWQNGGRHYDLDVLTRRISPGDQELELTMCMDVTDRQKLKQAQYEKLLLIDSVRIPTMLFDAAHNLIRVNNAACEIAGLPEEVIYSQPCNQSFCTQPTHPDQCPVRRALLDCQEHKWEVTLGTRDYLLNAYPIMNNGKLQYVLKTLTDITEANQIRKQLAEALAEANSANRARNYFLANMSHEIRTPLNAVIGFAELLQNGGVNEDESVEYLKNIHDSAHTLLKLFNDILALSRLESENGEESRHPILMEALLREVCGIFQLAADEKGIRLEVSCGAMPMIQLEPVQLRQVLLNLVGNAVKFTERGSVRLTARLLPPETLEIRIIDTGVGIKPEETRKIFEPFHQQDAVRDTHLYKGSGLGLSIAEKLIRKMNGTIEVESELGSGSTFIITLHQIAFAPAPARQ